MSLVSQLNKTQNQQQARPVLVLEDTQGKRIIDLDKNIYSIGRDSQNSIVLHSQLVSRHHATLLRVTNSQSTTPLFKIIDGDLQGNSSTNGLLINGRRCLSHSLKHKDLIIFGSKAQASYLVVTSDLSEPEIFKYYETSESGEFYNHQDGSIDPFETLVPSEENVETLSEAALLRLASFPELLPSPIIEIDLIGNITYLNSSALLNFPNLQEAKLDHSILVGLLDVVQNEKRQFFVREVEVDNAIYEQTVHYIVENRLVRSYLVDITQRKQAEKEREQMLTREQAARIEAETANRIKDEFLATLSHELRTPLNAMLGWTQMLRTRKLEEKTVTRAIETIDRNTKSLAQLIEDVLDVSRIITGKLRLNVRSVALAPIIEAALDTVRPAAEAKDIHLEFLFDCSIEPVLGDVNRLQQVIWNLLSNAVKFTPSGGRVEVRLEMINSQAQIRVSDTGQGISNEFLPFVFERFRQADSSTTRSHGGLGLGLAIVRHLVELQGGTVCAESPGVGLGATFIVNLPLITESVKVSEPEPIPATPRETVKKISPPLLDGLRILAVDDEADARELLILMLGQYGAEVTVVATVSEALEALARIKPNILVSDIGMPGEDGYTLIRKVRALDADQGGRIPAVALTAYARAEDRAQAILAGFQIHVPKPVNPGELAVVVANLVGRTGNS